MAKLIVLDRDGVINRDCPNFIRSPEEWIPLPGSLEAIAHLTARGYPVAVATNQSGVARGYFSLAILVQIHAKMLAAVKQAGGEISAIFYCPHHPDANCSCRKPKPGLLLQAAAHFDLPPQQLVMIGDSFRDLQAAANCGAAAILISPSVPTTATEIELQAWAHHQAIPICSDLKEALPLIDTCTAPLNHREWGDQSGKIEGDNIIV